MALHITADGSEKEVRPADGKGFTLAELQGFVGGYIEALYLPDGSILWLNEEGKLKGLPENSSGRVQLLAHSAGIAHDDYIVGDVLITTRAESGEEEEEE
jgi:hypothetical protein